MGAVQFSVDPELVRVLAESLPLTTFVETGTFKGDSIAAVRSLFNEVYSVELSEALYHEATERFKRDPAVYVLQGRSPDVLAKLRAELSSRSVLYWLDAHWCVFRNLAGAGETSQCPLLAEIEAIGALNPQSVALIDDARYFLCPPPEPHDISHWPSLDAVLKRLFRLSPRHAIMVLNDVMVFYPEHIEPTLREFARRHTVDWLAMVEKARQFDGLYRIARRARKGMFSALLGRLRAEPR